MKRYQNLPIFFLFLFLIQYVQAGSDSIYVDWHRRYSDNRMINLARKVLLDGRGNIYVSGESCDPLGYSNIDIVKYDSSGQKLWAVEYPQAYPPSNGNYMAIDRSGNIYLCATDYFSGELITIKQKGLDGSVEWVKRYTGAYGFASSILVDPNSNVYVSGSVSDTLQHQGFVTIKYDSNGVEKWSQIFDNNMGIETQTHLINDSLWNLYVVGYNASPDSLTGMDVLVVKYDSSGAELWRSSFSTPGNWDDIPADVVIDHQNRLLVLMDSNHRSVIVRFDPAGNISWVSDIFDNAIAKNIAIDTNNNIVFTALKETNQDSKFFIAKLDSGGTLLWSELFEGISSNGVSGLTGLILDNENNIYTAGQVLEQNFNSKMTVLKYSSDGNLIWFYPYEDTVSYEDEVSDFVLDNNKNIILTGTGFTSNQGSYFSTVKLIQETVVGISNTETSGIPFQLSYNYPNPFNSETVIELALSKPDVVKVEIYDITGRKVRTLMNGFVATGKHRFIWDGKNDNGVVSSSGVYVFRVKAGSFTETRRVTFLR